MSIIEVMRGVFNYIEDSLGSPIPLEDLSRMAGLSVFQLIRLFDRFTGMTPGAYIRARRLAQSLPFLLSGATVLSIALDFGFEYEQSYIRAFRDAYGMTPARFRRQQQPVEIVSKPSLGGFTVSASGILGQPKVLMRPAFQALGTLKSYNYQDNLLSGIPLLEGLAACETMAYAAACRPSAAEHFSHDYLILRESPQENTAEWAFPAGKWARFDYSGLHALDARGVSKIRLLMALVIGNWFADSGVYWDGNFTEKVDLAKCAGNYCELSIACFMGEL